MHRTILKSHVGADGVLQVQVPFGAAEANREVQVTIEPAPPGAMTTDEWRTWVEATAGSLSDPTFRRHEQGDFELREELP